MRFFLYASLLSEFLDRYMEWLDGNKVIPGIGEIRKVEKAKAPGYELRRFLGGYHLVKGTRTVYGVVVHGSVFPGTGWREIIVDVVTPSGSSRAISFLPMKSSPVNLLKVARKMRMKSLFFGGLHEYGEYIETVMSANPLGTETLSPDSQYII